MALVECGNCGAKISSNAETCPKCGGKKETDTTCWECGTLLPNNHEGKCPECGTPNPKINPSFENDEKPKEDQQYSDTNDQVSVQNENPNVISNIKYNGMEQEKTIKPLSDLDYSDKVFKENFLFEVSPSFPAFREFILVGWIFLDFIILKSWPNWLTGLILFSLIFYCFMSYLTRYRYLIMKDKIVEVFKATDNYFKSDYVGAVIPYKNIQSIDLRDGQFRFKLDWNTNDPQSDLTKELNNKELRKILDLFEIHQKKGDIPSTFAIFKPKAIKSRLLWKIASSIILIYLLILTFMPAFISEFMRS